MLWLEKVSLGYKYGGICRGSGHAKFRGVHLTGVHLTGVHLRNDSGQVYSTGILHSQGLSAIGGRENGMTSPHTNLYESASTVSHRDVIETHIRHAYSASEQLQPWSNGCGYTSHLDLTSVYLMDMCLVGVYLTGVYLIGVHLTGVYFIGVHLTSVRLIGVHFTGVHLTGVYLTGAHLTSVHLTGVHLTGVHLTGLHLTGLHLMGLHLIGVLP